jgi:hypothetical protein
MMLGIVRNTDDIPKHAALLKGLAIGIFLLALLPMIFGGKIYNCLKGIMTFKIVTVLGFLLILGIGYSHADTWIEIFSGFFRFGTIPNGQGNDLENIFEALYNGRSLPAIDMTVVGTLSALIAISGQGGLSNTPISNYTRDQGWGMGAQVGAIPSLVGGHNIQLSHMGTVFLVNEQSLPRWKRWVTHLRRDQLCLWMPACFFGLALPSMLSVEFLPRGQIIKDEWAASVMTADAVGNTVGGAIGPYFRFMVLFCGFLVLTPTMASTIDGFVRRWVDVFWTASKKMHTLDPGKIRHLYFAVLATYACVGLTMLALLPKPATLLIIASMIYNFALGFSCWHVAVLNSILLPPELRPGWLTRIGLVIVGIFFFSVGCMAAYAKFGPQ